MEKFFVLQKIEAFLMNMGIGQGISDLITFLIACAIMALLVWILDLVGSKVLVGIVHMTVKRTKTMWDDFLLKRKFFTRLIKFIAATMILSSVSVIFRGYHAELITITEALLKAGLVVIGTLICSSFLDALNDVYELKPIAKEKSIKGIIQAVKIILFVIGGILIISILLNRDPTNLLVGLSASAAIITLVFKDTILGFVASIQIPAQDMIRPGDWIEVPAKNADGEVIEINVNSVKVRNWNNTVTVIPIYSLVTEAFTNWRSMEESGGRRFKRPVLIDINTVRIFTQQETERLKACVSEKFYTKMIEMSDLHNSSDFTTNLGLYRAYIEVYLRSHPKVAHNLPMVIKYLNPDENGIAIELYGFSTEKNFVNFELVVADIFNHIIIASKIFDLTLYIRPQAAPSASQIPEKLWS